MIGEKNSYVQPHNMSVKQRIQMIDNGSKDGIKTLNENKKNAQLLRSECATLEQQTTEDLNDLLREILEDINFLEKDFLKIQQSDMNEVNFLKQQSAQL